MLIEIWRRVPSSRQRLIAWAKSTLHCQILLVLTLNKIKVVCIFPPFECYFWRGWFVGRFFPGRRHFFPMSIRGLYQMIYKLEARPLVLCLQLEDLLPIIPRSPVSDIQARNASLSGAFTAWRSAMGVDLVLQLRLHVKLYQYLILHIQSRITDLFFSFL